MKKKLLTFVMGTSLVMGLAACGGGSDDEGTDTAQSGAEKIYNQKCSSCHGDNLKGGVGPDLTQVGSRYSKDDILDILKNGKSGGMPAGLVQGDDANSVAEWLAAKK